MSTEAGAPSSAAPSLRQRALVALGTFTFLHAVFYRDGAFVYQFHKTSTGVWADEGYRIAQGELPYRDFFETLGPGLPLLNAAVIRAFGASLDALAGLGIALGVLLALALHELGVRRAGPRFGLLPVLAFVTVVYPPFDFGGPRWPALLLVLGGIGVLAARPGAAAAAGAGLLLGGALLVERPVALGALAGALLAPALAGRERAALAAAAALPVAALMGTLAAAAGPGRVAECWIAEAARVYAAEASLEWGPPTPRSLALLTLAVGGVSSAVAALRRREGREATTLAAAGLGLFLPAFTWIVDAYALGVHATLLLPLLAAAMARSRPARWAALGLLAPAVLHGTAGLLAWRHHVEPRVRQQFRAGEAWMGARAEDVAWVQDNARPGEAVFAFPSGGLLYFLTHTRNASSLHLLIDGRTSEEIQRRGIAELEARRPALGVWRQALRFQPPPGLPTLDLFQRELFRLYAPVRTLPAGIVLLRRRDLVAAATQ